jgi:hypothetical protein
MLVSLRCDKTKLRETPKANEYQSLEEMQDWLRENTQVR